MSLYILSIQVLCRGFVDPWAFHNLLILIGDFVLDVEGVVWNLVEGILNVLPGLSLFTLVFICIFPTWLMGACGFLSCSGFLRDKFFSLTLFGGQIGDLCNGCFIGGDFVLLGVVVHVGVVDPTCFLLGLPHWISPHSQLVDEQVLGKIRPSIVFFRCSWNLDQSFASYWNNFSTRVLYLLSWLVVSALHATEA